MVLMVTITTNQTHSLTKLCAQLCIYVHIICACAYLNTIKLYIYNLIKIIYKNQASLKYRLKCNIQNCKKIIIAIITIRNTEPQQLERTKTKEKLIQSQSLLRHSFVMFLMMDMGLRAQLTMYRWINY